MRDIMLSLTKALAIIITLTLNEANSKRLGARKRDNSQSTNPENEISTIVTPTAQKETANDGDFEVIVINTNTFQPTSTPTVKPLPNPSSNPTSSPSTNEFERSMDNESCQAIIEPSSNCFEDRRSETGCDDQSCQNLVCACDPYCCDNSWDILCASEYNYHSPGCSAEVLCCKGTSRGGDETERRNEFIIAVKEFLDSNAPWNGKRYSLSTSTESQTCFELSCVTHLTLRNFPEFNLEDLTFERFCPTEHCQDWYGVYEFGSANFIESSTNQALVGSSLTPDYVVQFSTTDQFIAVVTPNENFPIEN